MSSPATPSITILAIGRVGPDSVAPLLERFPCIEQIDLEVPANAILSGHAAALNRAIDGAQSSWILILRERERIGDDLARELTGVVREDPSAWAFRLRSEPVYLGRPLRLGRRDAGSVRLFHRRHARFDSSGSREMVLQGTVVRLQGVLRAETFATRDEHERFLAQRGVPHSLVRRVLLFTRRWLGSGGWRGGAVATTYLWVEAGWDLTDPAAGTASTRGT